MARPQPICHLLSVPAAAGSFGRASGESDAPFSIAELRRGKRLKMTFLALSSKKRISYLNLASRFWRQRKTTCQKNLKTKQSSVDGSPIFGGKLATSA
jgi:hypothetical protein